MKPDGKKVKYFCLESPFRSPLPEKIGWLQLNVCNPKELKYQAEQLYVLPVNIITIR